MHTRSSISTVGQCVNNIRHNVPLYSQQNIDQSDLANFTRMLHFSTCNQKELTLERTVQFSLHPSKHLILYRARPQYWNSPWIRCHNPIPESTKIGPPNGRPSHLKFVAHGPQSILLNILPSLTTTHGLQNFRHKKRAPLKGP